MVTMMRYPFEASADEIESDPEPFISAVFSSLESEFLLLPKGKGFVEYAAFEQGYEALKRATNGFTQLDPDAIEKAVLSPHRSLYSWRGASWGSRLPSGPMWHPKKLNSRSHRALLVHWIDAFARARSALYERLLSR
jgi:hypothetical protein